MAQGVEFPQLADHIPGALADALGTGGVALMSIDDHDRSRAVAGSDDHDRSRGRRFRRRRPAAGAGAGNGGPGKSGRENASANSW
ncbi:hypothetical protein AB0J63_18195 [Streptosporangium canum]|uniref:hypothetical protein n=1 Tax=Streptosporangium canum TaxID=324952 RepID=UPI0034435F3B